MTKHLATVCALAALVAISSPAICQTLVGGHAGYDFESSELYFGPDAIIPLPWMLNDAQLSLNPEFSWYLADCDGCSFWLISANVLYPFEASFGSPYAGAGIGIATFSYDSGFFSKSGAVQGSSDTELGINIKAGLNFGENSGKPFAEAGLYIIDSTWLYVQGGYRFTLGG